MDLEKTLICTAWDLCCATMTWIGELTFLYKLKRDASIGLGSTRIIFRCSLSVWSCNNALMYIVKFSSLVLNVSVVITLVLFDVCGHIAVQFYLCACAL